MCKPDIIDSAAGWKKWVLSNLINSYGHWMTIIWQLIWRFYFFNFFIRFSIFALYILRTEGPFNSLSLRSSSSSEEPPLFDGDACSSMDGKAIISTERTPSSCLEKRENKRQLWSTIMKTGYVNRYTTYRLKNIGIMDVVTVDYNGNRRTKDVI